MGRTGPRYDPPPDYSSSPAPRFYGPETFGPSDRPTDSATRDRPQQGSAPGRRTPIATVIGIVIALALCCCAFSAGLTVLGLTTSEEITATDPAPDDTARKLDSDGDARLNEWLAWDPGVPDTLGSPPQDKTSPIDEVSPHVYVTYDSGGDGSWTLVYWEYRYPGMPAE